MKRQLRKRPIRTMICVNCGRDFFATAGHYACPYCGMDCRPVHRGFRLGHTEPSRGYKTRRQANAEREYVRFKDE